MSRRSPTSRAPSSSTSRRRSRARSSPWTPIPGRVLAMQGGFSFARERVQPRHPGVAAAGLGVQAVRLFRGARQRLHAVLSGHGRADRNPRRQRRVAAAELRRQVLRAGDAQDRNREIAQRHDRAAGAGHGHAAHRRIRQALRHLRQPRALSADGDRRRRDHGAAARHRLRDDRQWRRARSTPR